MHEITKWLPGTFSKHRLLVLPGGKDEFLATGAQALIERQVRRMTRLVDSLLHVSRISHGRLRLRRERIDLRRVLSNSIETVQSDIKKRNHHLAVELPDAPVWLQADPWRLEQVFVNLLANASKYTDAGGELAAWMHTRDGQVVVRIPGFRNRRYRLRGAAAHIRSVQADG